MGPRLKEHGRNGHRLCIPSEPAPAAGSFTTDVARLSLTLALPSHGRRLPSPVHGRRAVLPKGHQRMGDMPRYRNRWRMLTVLEHFLGDPSHASAICARSGGHLLGRKQILRSLARAQDDRKDDQLSPPVAVILLQPPPMSSRLSDLGWHPECLEHVSPRTPRAGCQPDPSGPSHAHQPE